MWHSKILKILDITIAKNNVAMPACLIHFCVNANVTCMLDAYCALTVVTHNHFCCDAIRTQHLTPFIVTMKRIMAV
jgi:hypothetical protein